jgi:hypothetical protein
MFVESCHNWRLQWVLQCRVRVVSPMQPRWVFYSLRIIIFIYNGLQKYILFYKTRTNCMLIITILDDLSTFEYIESIMIFWSMNMIYGVGMNCVTVWCGWESGRLWLHCKWMWFWVSYKIGNIMHCVPTSTTQLLACLRAQPSYLHMHTYFVMWWNVLHAYRR